MKWKSNKRISVLIALILSFLTSCELLPDFDSNSSLNDKLNGRWEWVKSYGGFTGNALYTPESVGEQRYVEFQKKGVVHFWSNEKQVGSYNFIADKNKTSLLSHKKANMLTIEYQFRESGTDSVITLPMWYIIDKLTDELILSEDVYDGFGHEYVKVQER